MDIMLNEEPAGEPPPVKKKKSKKLFFITGTLVALVFLAAVGWLQYGDKVLNLLAPGEEPGEELCCFIPVKEFQVNLAGAGGRRYIRLKIFFGGSDRNLEKEVIRRELEIRSSIIQILRCTTVEDLEGREGMERLKAEILEQANSLLPSGGLEEVYFDNFLIQ